MMKKISPAKSSIFFFGICCDSIDIKNLHLVGVVMSIIQSNLFNLANYCRYDIINNERINYACNNNLIKLLMLSPLNNPVFGKHLNVHNILAHKKNDFKTTILTLTDLLYP